MTVDQLEPLDPLSDRDWHRTGVSSVQPCGCVYVQQVEIGADYHERWIDISRCLKHAAKVG
jgi:hypothetical protein